MELCKNCNIELEPRDKMYPPFDICCYCAWRKLHGTNWKLAVTATPYKTGDMEKEMQRIEHAYCSGFHKRGAIS